LCRIAEYQLGTPSNFAANSAPEKSPELKNHRCINIQLSVTFITGGQRGKGLLENQRVITLDEQGNNVRIISELW
jgi:hypothetical protein